MLDLDKFTIFDSIQYERQKFLSTKDFNFSYGSVDFDERYFKHFSKLEVFHQRSKYIMSLGIAAYHNEIKFYLIEGNRDFHVYLTLYDIYRILCTSKRKKNEIVNILKAYLENEKKHKYNVKYNNVAFELMLPSLLSVDKTTVADEERDLSFRTTEILLLLFIIQEKSNYYCYKSMETIHIKTVDGIVRMFIALLSSNQSIHQLENKGWNYSNKKYNFSKRYKFTAIVLEKSSVSNTDLEAITQNIKNDEIAKFLHKAMNIYYKDKRSKIPDITRISLKNFEKRNDFIFNNWDDDKKKMCYFLKNTVRYNCFRRKDNKSRFRSNKIENYRYRLEGKEYYIFILDKKYIQQYYLTQKEYSDIIGT